MGVTVDGFRIGDGDVTILVIAPDLQDRVTIRTDGSPSQVDVSGARGLKYDIHTPGMLRISRQQSGTGGMFSNSFSTASPEIGPFTITVGPDVDVQYED